MYIISIILLITIGQCFATTTLHLDCKLNYLICTNSLQLNNTEERCTCLEKLGTCLGEFEMDDDNIALITRECARISCTYPCEYKNEVAKANGRAIGFGLGIPFGVILLLIAVGGGLFWFCDRREDKKLAAKRVIEL